MSDYEQVQRSYDESLIVGTITNVAIGFLLILLFEIGRKLFREHYEPRCDDTKCRGGSVER